LCIFNKLYTFGNKLVFNSFILRKRSYNLSDMRNFLVASLVVAFLFVTVNVSVAQVLDADFKKEVYDKDHVPKRIPPPFQHVREADVMWSRTVWRKIDLREKLNQPLYYPDEGPLGTRLSLIDLLLWAIDNDGLTAYAPDDPANEFKLPITRNEIDERFGASIKTQLVENLETGQMEEKKVKEDAKVNEVKEYLIKELWYFDKQRSVMEVRIIGICPIRIFYKEEDVDREDPKRKKLFWIYMPEARKVLASHEVFNPFNDAERRTFDDIFIKRYFSSYIVQESNTFNNRQIETYAQGVDGLLEANRVMENIFKFEQDLWQY